MAIAIPAYQDYAVRAKVSEGINLAGASKLGVAETYSSRGTMPANNVSAGIPTAASINGKYVTSVTVGTGGLISILYSAAEQKISGDTLLLSPTTDAGSVKWRCKSTTVQPRYLPSECR
jgi:type IV pilus assembly protein PilA